MAYGTSFHKPFFSVLGVKKRCFQSHLPIIRFNIPLHKNKGIAITTREKSALKSDGKRVAAERSFSLLTAVSSHVLRLAIQYAIRLSERAVKSRVSPLRFNVADARPFFSLTPTFSGKDES